MPAAVLQHAEEDRIWFCAVNEVSGNEVKGTFVFDTKDGKKEIGVPREDYAEIFAYVTDNVQSQKPKLKSGKMSQASQATDCVLCARTEFGIIYTSKDSP